MGKDRTTSARDLDPSRCQSPLLHAKDESGCPRYPIVEFSSAAIGLKINIDDENARGEPDGNVSLSLDGRTQLAILKLLLPEAEKNGRR